MRAPYAEAVMQGGVLAFDFAWMLGYQTPIAKAATLSLRNIRRESKPLCLSSTVCWTPAGSPTNGGRPPSTSRKGNRASSTRLLLGHLHVPQVRHQPRRVPLHQQEHGYDERAHHYRQKPYQNATRYPCRHIRCHQEEQRIMQHKHQKASRAARSHALGQPRQVPLYQHSSYAISMAPNSAPTSVTGGPYPPCCASYAEYPTANSNPTAYTGANFLLNRQ